VLLLQYVQPIKNSLGETLWLFERGKMTGTLDELNIGTRDGA
jgi:hypothetical protein